jgi:outer membrane protein TolC
VKPFLSVLAALLCLVPSTLRAEGAPVGIKELAGLLSSGDPRLRISTQSVRAAEAAYRSAIAAAYPQVTATTNYSLDYNPDVTSQVPQTTPPFVSTQETQNQGTHLATARLSLSQLLPTAGTAALSVEDTMAVQTSTGVKTGTGDFASVDPAFSQAPKATLSVSQPILFNGKLLDMSLFPATLRKAQLGYLRSREDSRDLMNRSLAAATQSLFGVLALRASAGNGTRALELAQKRLEQARHNLELGLVSELDIWETEVAVGTQREGLLDLQYNLAKAEKQLAQSLGRDSLDGITLDERVPTLALALPRDEIVRQATARHPGIQADTLDLEGARLDRTIAGQQDATTVSLSFAFQPKYPATRTDTTFAGSFTDLGKDNASVDWTFGVGVSVPIYRGGRRAADAQSADARERMAADTLLLAKQQVSGDVDASLLTRSNLEAKVKLLASNADLLARRVEIERGLLALGKSTDLDVEAREIDLESKRAELWKAKADLFVSIINLYALAGEDLQRIIEGTTL